MSQSVLTLASLLCFRCDFFSYPRRGATVISGICDRMPVCVRAVKEKRLELSRDQTRSTYSAWQAVAWLALSLRSKKSQVYEVRSRRGFACPYDCLGF